MNEVVSRLIANFKQQCPGCLLLVMSSRVPCLLTRCGGVLMVFWCVSCVYMCFVCVLCVYVCVVCLLCVIHSKYTQYTSQYTQCTTTLAQFTYTSIYIPPPQYNKVYIYFTHGTQVCIHLPPLGRGGWCCMCGKPCWSSWPRQLQHSALYCLHQP